MGCTASKLDNEDTVRRCKERRRLMKEAVFSRLHLAAAHSDYCRSLRLTGTALSVFASGEPLSVSDQTPPAVLLRNPSSLSSSSANHFPPRVPPKMASPPGHAAAASAAAYRREYSHLGNDNEVPVPRSISRSTSLAPSESSRSNVSRSASFAPPPRERRRAPPPKLPHILSQSSLGSESNIFNNDNFAPSATYASTPSQASSVWNWENFYPPSPPSSEYFEQRKFATERQEFVNQQHEFANEHRDFGTNSQKSRHFADEDRDFSTNSQKSHRFANEDRDFSTNSHKSRHFADEDRDFSTSSQKSHRFANEDRGFSTNSQKSGHFADEDRDFSTSSQKSPRFANEDRDFSTNSHKSHHFADEHRDFSTNSLKSRQFANEHRDFSTNSQKSHHLIDDDEDDGDEGEETREEVQCSEWGDHYSTTSSSSLSDDGASRSEVGSRSNFSQSGASIVGQHQQASQQQAKKKYQPVMSDKSEEEEEEAEEEQASGYSAVSYGADMKMVVRHKDFAEIVAAIKENFDLAAEAGEKVSEMLDIGRAQLDRSFSQLKKTVYHSSGVFSNLSSSWTSKPPLSVKYRLDAGTLDEPGGPKSLCSTLERLLAWEKKLYDEVKAREGVKIELDKKLSTLQSQEYKGEDEAKVDKTKATINRLRSLVVVTSQAVTTTSTAIIGLRDSDLIPQLGELCHGFMYMWRSMNQYHEIQSQIVQQVQGLENRASKSDSTSDLHRQATRDLESAVSAWHSSFCRLVKFQRDFIRSLHGWFKLTLLPVNNDKDITPGNNRGASDAFSFCDEWKLALDRLPDTVASEAINSFVNVVHVIYVKQSEELKIKKRTEMVCKELEKKASNLRNIEKKYYHSYSMVGIGLPDTGPNNNYALDARDPLAEKKSELAACQRKVEDEMFRHSKAVEVTRAMTQNNLQTGLPGVFQAMSSFSALCVEALEAACTRSYAIK